VQIHFTVQTVRDRVMVYSLMLGVGSEILRFQALLWDLTPMFLNLFATAQT